MVHEQAEQVAPDVQYEFDMLDYAYRELSASDAKSSSARNADGECFLIHARNLIDFFCPPEKLRTDDIVARHFFGDPRQWEIRETELCQFSKTERNPMHKTLAHLSYRRIHSKSWEERKIYEELNAARSQFLELLAPEQRGWFK